MTNKIINFPDPNKPDSEQTITGDFGEQWYKFSVSYQFGGEVCTVSQGEYGDTYNLWSFDIWSRTEEEALERVEAIKKTAVISGKVFSEECK